MAKKTGKTKSQTPAPVANDKPRPGEKRSAAKPGQTTGIFYRREIWIALALALVTLAVYAQVINHQFISLDDDLYITNNPMVSKGLTAEGVKWAFTTFHAAN